MRARFEPSTRFVLTQFIEIGGDHLDQLMAAAAAPTAAAGVRQAEEVCLSGCFLACIGAPCPGKCAHGDSTTVLAGVGGVGECGRGCHLSERALLGP